MLDWGYYNMDCMAGMREFPDKYFDLAIVDPPYGLGLSMTGQIGTGNMFIPKEWDSHIPSDEYFTELKRVAKYRIIWGANYFNNLQGGRIIWNKLGIDTTRRKPPPTFSHAEIAYTNCHNNIKMFSYTYIGNVQGNNYRILGKDTNRIHPTQKPVALYRWLLQNYAKPGDRLISTHVGSASDLIAFEMEGFTEYVGFELDVDYYHDSVKRLETWRRSRTVEMFEPKELRMVVNA